MTATTRRHRAGRSPAHRIALWMLVTALAAIAAIAPVSTASAQDAPSQGEDVRSIQPIQPTQPALGILRARQFWPEIRWRRSKAYGRPWAGRLVRGVRLPREGPLFTTIHPVRNRLPNAGGRRYGTSRLIWSMMQVIERYHLANPSSRPLVIGDIARKRGGSFEPVHASHQNGLDVDIYYPRLDGRLAKPTRVRQIDLRRAQALVDQWVLAGAEMVLVGPNTPLKGPRGVVMPWPHHDNHIHVRIPRRAKIQRKLASRRWAKMNRSQTGTRR